MKNSRRIARRRALTGPLQLEDRSVPAVFTALINPSVDPTGAVAELVGIFQQVNANTDADDTVNLFPGGRYTFLAPFEKTDGGTALPAFTPTVDGSTLTIEGTGATFTRPADTGGSLRFLRARGDFLSGVQGELVI